MLDKLRVETVVRASNAGTFRDDHTVLAGSLSVDLRRGPIDGSPPGDRRGPGHIPTGHESG